MSTTSIQIGALLPVLDISINEENATAVLTLNRPERRNALTFEFVNELGELITELDQRESTAAIVLTGADPAFCAGFDLRGLATEDRGAQRARQSAAMKHRGLLPDHNTPIIGAINGAAVTGGLELALGCDFLIASANARFADTHARVGAMPGGGLTIRLPERIGVTRARQMSFTGDFIDADTALRWGLVNEVVPHEELLTRAGALASAIASIPIANVREIRRMYAEISELEGDAAYETEHGWARTWMAERFDQKRLDHERSAIIHRGSSQT